MHCRKQGARSAEHIMFSQCDKATFPSCIQPFTLSFSTERLCAEKDFLEHFVHWDREILGVSN